jgi:hypothetical protein
MRKLQGNKLVITFVCESIAVHSHNVHSTHKQPLQHIPSTTTDSSMFQHHIMGKHYTINSCHNDSRNGVLKSSSLIEVFNTTTMNQNQKLTFHQKAQLHTTKQKNKNGTQLFYIFWTIAFWRADRSVTLSTVNSINQLENSFSKLHHRPHLYSQDRKTFYTFANYVLHS